jgi:hypothetical protein
MTEVNLQRLLLDFRRVFFLSLFSWGLCLWMTPHSWLSLNHSVFTLLFVWIFSVRLLLSLLLLLKNK